MKKMFDSVMGYTHMTSTLMGKAKIRRYWM